MYHPNVELDDNFIMLYFDHPYNTRSFAGDMHFLRLGRLGSTMAFDCHLLAAAARDTFKGTLKGTRSAQIETHSMREG